MKKKRAPLTAMSLKRLRETGFIADKVEHWNMHAKPFPRTVDMFGIIDIVAAKPGEGIIGIQTTSFANRLSRIKKIRESEFTQTLLKSGMRIILHSWKQAKARAPWVLTEIEIKDEPTHEGFCKCGHHGTAHNMPDKNCRFCKCKEYRPRR